MTKRVGYFSLIIFTSLFLLGCSDQVGTLDVSNSGGLGENYSIVFNDTTTILTSTILLDSIPTSSTTNLMIGQYHDDKVGTIESKAFFQVWMPGGQWAPTTNQVFDSLVLVLNPSGYYYGDTAVVQKFEVREIAEDFKTYDISQAWIEEGYYSRLYIPASLYNTSVITTKPSTLGTFSLKPKPVHKDSITVRLSDVLGQQWLQEALKTDGSNFVSNTKFLDYFKGLSIQRVAGEDGQYIIGLSSTDKIFVRFYFHENGTEQLKGKHFNFSFTAVNSSIPYKYNKISSDRSLISNLAALTLKREISSTLTDNETYVESGVGIVTKIKLPYLRELRNLPGMLQLNNARLVIEPIKDSYNGTRQLPAQLVLMGTDRSNFPLTYLLSDHSSYASQLFSIASQAVPQTASIGIDPELKTNTGYSFQVTQFVQNVLNTQVSYESQALLLSTPVSDLFGTVNRVSIGGSQHQRYRMRLEIYYLAKKE